MKRSSSPSLRFLAAAANANEATVTMSSRAPYRGGRNRQRRGYSDHSYSSGDGGRGRGEFVAGDSHSQFVSDVNRGFRPVERPNFDSRSAYGSQPRPPRRGFSDQSSSSSGVGGGRGQFVTGDSHFQSVGEANRGYRPVERPNFDYRSAHVSQPRPPHFNPQPPYSSPPPPFYPPPHFNPNPLPHFGPNPPPHFNHNPPPHFNQTQRFRPQQQFRPRPSKPLDYRNWESAKLGPPPHCERFKVLSYNILADYLAFSHTSKLYFHIPRKMLEWEWRKRSLIFELGLWSADILCFQEVDKFQDLEEELKLQGYSGIWKMRTGDPVDGCAIFWRVSRFKLLHEECIEYNKLGLRDNVAQICVLEPLKQKDNKDISALPLSLTGCNKVVVCNIHVLYNPRRGEIKLGQIRVLLDRAHAVSKLWDDAPIVLCGDFNCTPKSPLYNYISERELNLSDLPRDKLSGQASAEIRPPRPFSPYIRAQPADSRDGASAVVGHGELRQRPQSGSPLDVQEQSSHPESNSVDLPSVDSLSQPHCGNTVLNLFGGQSGNKNGTSSPKMTEDTLQKIDGCKDETRSSVSVPDGGLKGNTCSNLNETELTKETHQDTVDGCNDAFHAMVSVSGSEVSASRPQNQGEVSGPYRKDSLVDSHLEDVTQAEHEKKTNATQQSEPNLQTENDIMSCERSKLCFSGSTYSTDATTDPTLCSSNSGISSSELFHETSFPSTMKVSIMGSSENFSSQSIANDKDNPSNLSEVNVSYELTSTEELSETNYEEESFGEDSTTFLSELHDGNGPFSSDSSHAVRSDESFREPATVPHSRDEALENDDRGMDSEPADALKLRYDPSAWTPMEIETATGNADCTLVEHPLMLRSTYAEVEDCSGTRDSNGEPLVTSYNRCFLGTVDYIWRSEGLQTVRVLAPIPKHAMQWTPGFPTKKWGSDHIALVSELAFVKDGSIHNTDDP